MKLLVNGTPLLTPLTGIGHYTWQLCSQMASQPDIDLLMAYGMRYERGLRMPTHSAAGALQTAGYGLLRRLLPNPRRIKRAVEQARFAWIERQIRRQDYLYHEPNILPLPYAGPTIITLHDLSCFDHPETHPAERVEIMHRELPPAIERVDHIIVISEATRRAVAQRFGVPDSRMTVTLLAAHPNFAPRPAASLQAVLAKLDLQPGGYLLSVGTLEPRKNLTTLFQAYSALPDSLRQRYPLAVVGMPGWHTDQLMSSARQLVERGELRFLGYVDDAVLPLLYAGAAAFAYPSRYEGFGLPPLEAMASGVPVLVSDVTSLPEVVGDAGVRVGPDDVDAMRDGLRRLLEDRDYAAQLAQQGLARAQGFSWEKCARETRAVYDHVLRARGLA
jgi:alpha-1,3-rhamnosyl/mannosyltransferase